MTNDSPVGVFCSLRFFLATAMVALCGVASAQSSPIYPVTPFTTVPFGSQSTIVAADFNGDGIADAAYVSLLSPVSVQVALGTTSGSFTLLTPQALTVSAVPAALPPIIAGDLNGDHKTDLVISYGGYIIVLLGNGDGTFQTPTYYSISSSQLYLALADFNGDGYPDIVAAGSSVTGIPGSPGPYTTLLNKGGASAGQFNAAVDHTVSMYVSGVGVGDFNGDGKQDLFFSGRSALNVAQFATLNGNGDGTFASPAVVSGTGNFAIGDFNRDGISDVAWLPSGSITGTPTVSVLLGSHSGLVAGSTLALANIVAASTTYPSLTLAGASHGGTYIDLAVTASSGATTILLGDGSGNFSMGNSYALWSAWQGALGVYTNSSGVATLVYLSTQNGTLASLPGNADGSFQGVQTQPIAIGMTPVVGDVNADGLPDVLSSDSAGHLTTSLNRGNGTFTNLTSGPTITNGAGGTGDFNGDGKLDLVVITPGQAVGSGGQQPADSFLTFYAGNGDGTFATGTTAVDIGVNGATTPVIGDFNRDGKIDLLIPYTLQLPASGNGFLFLAGHGDGTFATPVSVGSGKYAGPPLVADLNGDGKLDFIDGANLFLGNGDGTFNVSPLGLTVAQPALLADLNGDGKLDLFASGSMYAGHGDGTFSTTPFYTPNVGGSYVSAGDVNGDGNTDLVFQAGLQVQVLLGSGTGTFTADSNTYYDGTSTIAGPFMLARLNNAAPALSSDKYLDYLAFTSYGITPLLNKHYTAGSVSLLPTMTALTASATSVTTSTSVTLTATVSGGLSPSGSVKFLSGSTTLGTGTISGHTATLMYTFATAGSYSVTAAYQGDTNNAASTSSAVSVTSIAPDFTLTANPSSATVTRGQSASTTVTLTPVGGYTGSVSLSCGTLPAGVTCVFSPATLSPTGTSAVTSTLTITTTAPSMARSPGFAMLPAVGLLALLGLPLTRSRRKLRGVLSVLLLAGALGAVMGCSSSKGVSNPGTPQGTQTVSVSASGAGSVSHQLNFTLTVQ